MRERDREKSVRADRESQRELKEMPLHALREKISDRSNRHAPGTPCAEQHERGPGDPAERPDESVTPERKRMEGPGREHEILPGNHECLCEHP